jgi:hypothetical protein
MPLPTSYHLSPALQEAVLNLDYAKLPELVTQALASCQSKQDEMTLIGAYGMAYQDAAARLIDPAMQQLIAQADLSAIKQKLVDYQQTAPVELHGVYIMAVRDQLTRRLIDDREHAIAMEQEFGQLYTKELMQVHELFFKLPFKNARWITL